MTFIPAHSAIVFYSSDDLSSAIDENDIGAQATNVPELPVLPADRKVLGYTNLPQTSRGLGNSKGFALGFQGAAYNKRGVVSPQIDLEIRPASVDVLDDLFPDSDGVLPEIALYVYVKGESVDIYRHCKPSSLDFKFDGKGGSELTISASFMALAHQYHPIDDSPITGPTSDELGELGTPLFWHDVRKFNITHTVGTTSETKNYRRALMSLSAKVDYGLERKNQRPDYGDDNPLSRTSYALLEHHRTVTGEMALHERLPQSFFSTAARSQNWGDIEISCSNDPDGADKGFTLTLKGAFPSDETQQSAEASAEIDHTVAFTADDITCTVD